MSSWCWLGRVPESLPGAEAIAALFRPDGSDAGFMQAWPRGNRKPTATALRVDERIVDARGRAAWISLIIVPRSVWPLFDDPAVSHAMRRVLSGPAVDAFSTFVRDSVHWVGSITVVRDDPGQLARDPFARLYPQEVFRVGPGLLGRVPAPTGPVIQRYSGKPWPTSGFDY
jgi:hypothetical protein